MLHRSHQVSLETVAKLPGVLPTVLFVTSLVGSFLLAGFSDTNAKRSLRDRVGQNSRSDNPILNLVDSFKFPRIRLPGIGNRGIIYRWHSLLYCD
jgi:sulfonate transport system substrate-binding protein